MRLMLTALLTIFALTACEQGAKTTSEPAAPAAPAYTAEEIEAETDRLNVWFDEKFEENLQFSPISKTFLGRDTDQDKIDDFSIEAQDEQLEWVRAASAEMQADFDYDKLTLEGENLMGYCDLSA